MFIIYCLLFITIYINTLTMSTGSTSETPLKQAITIYIDMHSLDITRKSLDLRELPDDFTHTLVSAVGKLGCNYPCFFEDDDVLRKVNHYKDIFQGNTIGESNKFLAESVVENVFEEKGPIDSFKINYPNHFERSLDYHHSYVQSANKSRVLRHERIYTSHDKDAGDDPETIENEKKRMGIYVIETYNMRSAAMKDIFDGLKFTNEEDNPLLSNNMCEFGVMKYIYEFLNENNEEDPSEEVAIIIGMLIHFDTPYKPLINRDEFELLHEERGTDPKPEYDEQEHTFKEIFDGELDGFNHYKIREIKLSEILRLFYILGFKHVNIVDDSCRGVDLEKDDVCLDFMTKGHRSHHRLRRMSKDEKELASQFFKDNPDLGGGRKRRKTKRKTKRRKTKRQNRKNKSKKYVK